MNFSETLAYWYLRLNGFFPLINFVLHRDDETIRHSADCDILAVRHPNVYEEIGGQAGDWDQNFFQWDLDINTHTVGLIVEVKTGRNTGAQLENIKKSFGRDRLKYAVQRLGFWPSIDADRIVTLLEQRPHILENGYVIAKLLITDELPRCQPDQTWNQIALKEVDEFIRRRFNQYRANKHADRFRFPADLLQYMIWKESV